MLACAVSVFSLTTRAASAPQPPVANRIPRVTELHGEKLVDNYFWLRERSNSAVVAYLKAENAYTDAMMKPAEKLEKSLYKEMVKRIKETDSSVPYRKGKFLYYTRTEKGKDRKSTRLNSSH